MTNFGQMRSAMAHEFGGPTPVQSKQLSLPSHRNFHPPIADAQLLDATSADINKEIKKLKPQDENLLTTTYTRVAHSLLDQPGAETTLQAWKQCHNGLFAVRKSDWLDAEHIYHLAERLITWSQDDPNARLGNRASGNWWIVPINYTLLAHQGTTPPLGFYGENAATLAPFDKAKFTVHFVHFAVHWAVLIYQRSNGNTFFFDSQRDESQKDRSDAARDEFRRWLQASGKPLPPGAGHAGVNVPNQEDAWSCGLHAIVNAMSFLRYESLRWDQVPGWPSLKSRPMRRHLITCLHQLMGLKFVPPETPPSSGDRHATPKGRHKDKGKGRGKKKEMASTSPKVPKAPLKEPEAPPQVQKATASQRPPAHRSPTKHPKKPTSRQQGKMPEPPIDVPPSKAPAEPPAEPAAEPPAKPPAKSPAKLPTKSPAKLPTKRRSKSPERHPYGVRRAPRGRALVEAMRAQTRNDANARAARLATHLAALVSQQQQQQQQEQQQAPNAAQQPGGGPSSGTTKRPAWTIMPKDWNQRVPEDGGQLPTQDPTGGDNETTSQRAKGRGAVSGASKTTSSPTATSKKPSSKRKAPAAEPDVKEELDTTPRKKHKSNTGEADTSTTTAPAGKSPAQAKPTTPKRSDTRAQTTTPSTSSPTSISKKPSSKRKSPAAEPEVKEEPDSTPHKKRKSNAPDKAPPTAGKSPAPATPTTPKRRSTRTHTETTPSSPTTAKKSPKRKSSTAAAAAAEEPEATKSSPKRKSSAAAAADGNEADDKKQSTPRKKRKTGDGAAASSRSPPSSRRSEGGVKGKGGSRGGSGTGGRKSV